ncbi:IucA/IucC family protein [Kushneria phyllosphaerae]|uniref:Aerobactin synthase n=1 Tax=Kushneria phyllosphaerae TaxID=2100822 RepID=A0A2R8CJH4_9GAMM|nr:IucA/IucC family protein [Kushneria phyllosphaerae]SPJ33040.1 Aerobactin synthase [Kushneria phyllosphaerae]
MTMIESRTVEQSLLETLVNALLAERFLDHEALAHSTPLEGAAGQTPTLAALGEEVPTIERAAVREAGSQLWSMPLDGHTWLVMLVRPDVCQAQVLVPGTQIVTWQGDAPVGARCQVLDAEALMRTLARAFHPQSPEPDAGEQVFLKALATTRWQLTRSCTHAIRTRGLMAQPPMAFFTLMEQWASLIDRPYHPTAKAKEGLDEAEYVAFMAEFDQPVTLGWVAIRRDAMITGAQVGEGEQPADFLMTPAERDRLITELHGRGLAESHIALPVHPWQQRHALPQWLGEALESGECVVLSAVSERWKASSSLRSLLPGHDSRHSVKLPMAIHSLGASRYLPAVKMINGDLSAALLEQARGLDPRLGEALHLCEEGRWWGWMPEGASLFDEAPRHLSAMVRSYPAEVMADPACRLVPMAVLGTRLPEGEHFFDHWLDWCSTPATRESVCELLAAVCDRFFELTLRLFCLGMLPEVHGQNAVLVWREGQITGLVLRDHDSLRIALSQLSRCGLEDPEYRIKPGHANTLYHDDPAALLFWLQTLAIQVNVRAIVDATASHFDVEVSLLWQTVATSLRGRIDEVVTSPELHALLIEQLFEAPSWPFKQLIRPIIARAGGPGSMPFGTGESVNPLRQISNV